MRFSAWFFGSLRRKSLQLPRLRPASRRAAPCPSSDASRSSRRASISKNSSGERDRTTGPPSATSAPYFTGWRAVSASKADERIAGPFGLDREGEVGLVAVAFAQMPVHARRSAGFVVGERPVGLRIEDRPVGRRRGGSAAARCPTGRRTRRSSISGVRRPSGSSGCELRLEQIAGLVGEIAGQPFAGAARRFCLRRARGEESAGVMRLDDLRRLLRTAARRRRGRRGRGRRVKRWTWLDCTVGT